MNLEHEKKFIEIDSLLNDCEKDNNLNVAESRLFELLNIAEQPVILARIYGKLAQVENYRYEYALKNERLVIAEKGVNYAKKGLEYDENCVEANSWAAAMMGIHGLEMGIMSTLFYLDPIKKHAEKAVKLEPAFHYGQPHLILGELYRLAPPAPIGVRDRNKALEHLKLSVELGQEDPQARFHLAELYLGMRKKIFAENEIKILLEKDIKVRGVKYAENWKQKSLELQKKIK